MNGKCGQTLGTDDRRTFMKVLGADKDVSLRQTLGNDNNNAMSDCKRGFIIVLLPDSSFSYDPNHTHQET